VGKLVIMMESPGWAAALGAGAGLN
jgi:hypothetical protein